MDAKMIANQLNAKILDVVHYLLPDGKQNKNEWVVGSVRGEPGKSLKVCLTGSKAGVWADFASGEAGDALDLWKAVRGVNTKEALEEASSWLGLHSILKELIAIPIHLIEIGQKLYQAIQFLTT